MIKQSTVLALIVALSRIVWSVPVGAASAPTETIRSTITQVMTILQNPAHQGPARRQERLEQVSSVILPHFDTHALAQRALGVHWRQRTEAEQQEFVHLFTELIEHTYSSTLDRYAADVQVFYDQERLDGDQAEVDTRVMAPSQEQPVSINYFLHVVGGRWLVYDVQINNVSMVRNYRNQFNRILSTGTYADLVQRIKNMLQEQQTASS